MGSGDQPVDDENDPSGDGLDDEDAEGSAGEQADNYPHELPSLITLSN